MCLGGSLFYAVSINRKPLVDATLLLLFHDAVLVAREQRALQLLALVVASLHAFRAVAHSRVLAAHLFCIVFGRKFNIMSTLSAQKSLTLPQKNDSREGLF
jgi:hypothetical protein